MKCSPRELADRYYELYAGAANFVVFCSVVRRSKPYGVTKDQFKQLAGQFNQRLEELADGIRIVTSGTTVCTDTSVQMVCI